MSLRVDLSGNGTGFEQMLNKARMQAKAFSNTVQHEVSSSWGSIGKNFAAGFAGMLTVQGIKSGVDWFINTGREIKETAEQVDMSTDSWQKWTQAVDDANLSLGGFQRVVDALHQKRTDALSDPQARGDLTRLGFSDSDITGNMDMSDFTQRALENANKGDLQRSYLTKVIGERGLKYSTVLGNLPNEKAEFSSGDIATADAADKEIKHATRIVATKTVGLANTIGDYLSFVGHLFTWSQRDWAKDAMANGHRLGKYADADLLAIQAQNDKDAAYSAAIDALRPKGQKIIPPALPAVIDPMDDKLAQQKEEMALHEQERQERLLDSQRSLMTIGDRRTSIRNEMPGLAKQIADRTSKVSGEGFLTDAQKDELAGITGKSRTLSVNALRQKYQDDTDNLQLRLNKDTGDLREKPLSFGEDSMSKVGLYSASNVAFNPLLGVQQRTNQILTEINTGIKNLKPKPLGGPDSP